MPRKFLLNENPVQFGTKAETLERLAPKLKQAIVLPRFCFNVRQWQKDKQAIVDKLKLESWFKQALIVRSSTQAEDSADSSMAGHYCSILNVKGEKELFAAIDKTISSYDHGCLEDQVLVQPMLENVRLSGVAFSFDPNNNSPYLVINYDDETTSTDTITSGAGKQQKNFYCLKRSKKADIPESLRDVVNLIYELEDLFQSEALDIEFAVDNGGQVYLLQCRPLKSFTSSQNDLDLESPLNQIEDKIKSLQAPHPYLLGSSSVFGIMPDWNPAEIIGTRPRPLALSLYQELVTDSIWAYQRDNYGYRNLRSFPLVLSFGGQPYIDVRVDFNSFVPSDLDTELGERLVNYYIKRLVENPSAHDKIEFDVVYTCYTFDLTERLKSLQLAGFSEDDCQTLTDSLRGLTNKIIRRNQGLWQKDLEKINRLRQRQDIIIKSDLDTLSKIYWLLEDCKRYGTLPFAGLARAAFIAVQMLKSLVEIGVISKADYNIFMLSLNTVNGEMSRDFHQLSKFAFLEKYGHLRPGTYDILSSRYDEEANLYFDWSKQELFEKEDLSDFALTLQQYRQVEKLLEEHKLEHDVLGLFDFLRAAIEGREMSKFVFTRSLSEALSLFKQLGAQWGFSADDCSYAQISCIKSLYGSSNDIADTLAKSIEYGKRSYQATCKLKLPPLIVKPQDIWSFQLPASEPNFITQKTIAAKTIQLSSEKKDLSGAIVFIPSADPGYDWIFSNNIGGLVTMYGGANSHMAIRAGELGIPAVIGAGEVLYQKWLEATVLQIDCMNCQVLTLKKDKSQ